MPNIIAQDDNSHYIQKDDLGIYIAGNATSTTQATRVTRAGNIRVTRGGNVRVTHWSESSRVRSGMYVQEPA